MPIKPEPVITFAFSFQEVLHPEESLCQTVANLESTRDYFDYGDMFFHAVQGSSQERKVWYGSGASHNADSDICTPT